MYNIILLDSAHKDLHNIYEFCSNISINYALKVRKKIAESLNSLIYFPFATPIYFIIDNHIIRKKIVDNRYLIIFSIIQKDIFIYNIIDGRQNMFPSNLFNIN